MNFRDDKDAHFARAEALGREVDELRERNAELEAEAVAGNAAKAELERLAARRVERPSVRARAKERRKGGHDLERTFARWAFPVFVFNVTFGFPALLVAAVWLSDRVDASGWTLLLPVLWIPGSGLAYLAYRSHAVRRELAWIDALPPAFDPASYFAHITTDFSGRLTLRIRFASKPEPGAQRLLADAIEGAVPGSTARWEDDLVVRSPKYETHVGVGRGSFVTNAKPHRWCKRIVARALPPIAALHPIERISVA